MQTHLRSLEIQIGELQEAIGKGILPLATDFVKFLTDATNAATEATQSFNELTKGPMTTFERQLETIARETEGDLIKQQERLNEQLNTLNATLDSMPSNAFARAWVIEDIRKVEDALAKVNQGIAKEEAELAQTVASLNNYNIASEQVAAINRTNFELTEKLAKALKAQREEVEKLTFAEVLERAENAKAQRERNTQIRLLRIMAQNSEVARFALEELNAGAIDLATAMQMVRGHLSKTTIEIEEQTNAIYEQAAAMERVIRQQERMTGQAIAERGFLPPNARRWSKPLPP
jgi:hypothetical protein